MADLMTLYEFLVSLLPADLTAKALTLAPVVVALVGLLRRVPWFAVRRRWMAPLAALVLGQGFGYAAVGFDPAQLILGAGAGLVITLAAIGGHSAVKNGVQAAAEKDRAA